MKKKKHKHKYFDGTSDNIHMSGYEACIQFTCQNCGMNIRFDPEYNSLYGYPIMPSEEDRWCDLKMQ